MLQKRVDICDTASLSSESRERHAKGQVHTCGCEELVQRSTGGCPGIHAEWHYLDRKLRSGIAIAWMKIRQGSGFASFHITAVIKMPPKSAHATNMRTQLHLFLQV